LVKSKLILSTIATACSLFIGGLVSHADTYEDVKNLDDNAVATKVIKGDFGNGDERKTNLGSRYESVQAVVNNILNANATATTSAVDTASGIESTSETVSTVTESTEAATQTQTAETTTQAETTAPVATPTSSSWADWSPEAVANYMANATGVSASTWLGVIARESGNNPYAVNASTGCYGYLQLHPVHGNVSGMTPEQYLQTAVGVFQSQGAGAWEAW